MNKNIKIDYISDLHVNFIYPKRIFWKIIKYPENPWKYLLLAWDFAENMTLIDWMLDELIRDWIYEKIFITWWNHDLRLHKNDYKRYWIENSIQKYHYLNKKFHNFKEKIHVLDVEPFICKEDKLIIFWSLAWYNYWIEKIDKKYLENHFWANFDSMKFKNAEFNDKNYIKFGEWINSNLEFANYLYEKLENQLLESFSDEKYINYNKILLTHVKPFKNIDKTSIYHRSYSKEEWEKIIKGKDLEINVIKKYQLDLVYWGAFYVNSRIEELINRFKIKYCIWGHSHSNDIEEYKWTKYLTNCYWYHWNYTRDKKIEWFLI